MGDNEGQDHYESGELFVYTNGDRWELGMVKRSTEDGNGYFCWYSCGDTAAWTPVSCMHKLANAGFTHVEKLLEPAENAKAENAKLRDFAKSYLDAAGVDCGICPYRDPDPDLCDTETDPLRDGCRLYEEMRKLGIEVGP